MGQINLHKNWRPLAAVAVLAGALVAACSSSVSSPAPVASVAGITSAPSTTSVPASAMASGPVATGAVASGAVTSSAVGSAPVASGPLASAPATVALPGFSGVPTTLDPCQLVPPNEASTVAGATYSAGTEQTTSGNGKVCVYGAGTTNVFDVLVVVAPDAATAQQAKAAFVAQLNTTVGGTPVNATPVSGVGDSAEFAAFTSLQANGAALYALKGATFFALVDAVAGGSAPSQATLTTEAQSVAGRLP